MPSQYELEQAQQGGGNFLSRLKNMFTPSPTSTAGMLGNQDAYNQYVQMAIQNGEQPMSRMEFLQQMQKNPDMMRQFTGQ